MKNLMVCGNANKSLKLNESESTKDRYILEGLFAGPFGVENRNKRIYKADEYLKHLQYLRDDIKNGEPLLGELDHPDDRFEVKMKEVSHRILDLWYDKASNTIQGKLELLNTPNGKLAQSLVDQGIPLHISSRAAGSVNPDKTVSIQQIYTFDLVCKPGFANAVLHRVNESENHREYTDAVKKFLTESERAESRNAAPQFGMINEDVTITEVASEVNLRDEAKEINENNNTDDMIEKTNVISEEEKKQKNKVDSFDEDGKDKKTEDDANDNADDNNDNADDKDDGGVEIISVRAETTGDSDDDGVEIEEVKSDDSDDDSDDDDKTSDDSDDSTDESECTDKDQTDEKKATDTDDKEKEMLFDCDDLKERKEKFEDKLDSLIDAIKTKGEDKKANESQIINKYPISSLLTKSNFAGFMGLNESQKNNVITYLQDHNMTNIDSVNENWARGIDYNNEEEVWLKYAPKNYRQLYENASDAVKESIKTTASFILFENQYDINNFWDNTGIAYNESRNVLNENFINTMPKIVAEPEQNILPYGSDFIKAVTEMACEYN